MDDQEGRGQGRRDCTGRPAPTLPQAARVWPLQIVALRSLPPDVAGPEAWTSGGWRGLGGVR